jgi:hypothetical protein
VVGRLRSYVQQQEAATTAQASELSEDAQGDHILH